MENKRFTLDINAEIHKKLKSYCVERGISMKEVVIKAIEEIIKAADNLDK